MTEIIERKIPKIIKTLFEIVNYKNLNKNIWYTIRNITIDNLIEVELYNDDNIFSEIKNYSEEQKNNICLYIRLFCDYHQQFNNYKYTNENLGKTCAKIIKKENNEDNIKRYILQNLKFIMDNNKFCRNIAIRNLLNRAKKYELDINWIDLYFIMIYGVSKKQKQIIYDNFCNEKYLKDK